MNKICVIGSINMDLVLNIKEMPKLGETIFASNVKNVPGGKGANQAIACSRLGCNVHMISKVGNDENGKLLVENLEKDNVNVKNIFEDKNLLTGVAIVSVDEKGNNSIVVASGANMNLNKEDIYSSESTIKECDIIVSQFEVPVESIKEAFKIAKDHNKITILNPAPAKKIPEELLKYTDIVIPNETEIFEITNIEVNDLNSAEQASKKLIEKGVKSVIITLGSKGASIVTKDESILIPSVKVQSVDTTAAGDTFIGAFVSKLNVEGFDFEDLKSFVEFANKVSSITVQREGAQPSIPYLEEVNKIYNLKM